MATIDMPIRIGSKTIKNRITMAPTVKFTAGDDGLVTEDYVEHYEERAKHECGLICVEATCISKEGRLYPSQLGLWCDEQIEGHRQIVNACHRHGAAVIVQIHHGGLKTHPDCGPMKSPTATMWDDGYSLKQAEELSVSEIREIIQQFTDAAVRAQKAGYDGVQLHGCHGYLINDFTSYVNQRTDEYGGSIENMARLGCDIIRRIREACGTEFMISMRISGCDPSMEDAISVGECYVAAGCDYLQVSNGIAPIDDLSHDESLPYNRTVSLGVRMHEHFKGRIPISVVNGLRTTKQVHYLFEHDLTDTIDLACGILADPAFAEAILHGTAYEKCRNCKDCGFGPKHHICPAMKARGGNEFSHSIWA